MYLALCLYHGICTICLCLCAHIMESVPYVCTFVLISRDSYISYVYGFVLISRDSYHMFVALCSYHVTRIICLWLCAHISGLVPYVWLCAPSRESYHMFDFCAHISGLVPYVWLCAYITGIVPYVRLCAHITGLVPYCVSQKERVRENQRPYPKMCPPYS